MAVKFNQQPTVCFILSDELNLTEQEYNSMSRCRICKF